MGTTEGKKLVNELHSMQRKSFIENIKKSTPYLIAKGLWVFAGGLALLITSLYAIYQAHYTHMPIWGHWTLTVAGVLVIVPAAILLGKFFTNVGKA